jgi:molybdopterin-containing oxidoreductase family iron-sulfur binding subunit
MNTALDPANWDDLRERLATGGGKPFWRSIEELAESHEFTEYLEREFPDQAGEWTNPVTRRQFLTLMGASFALAGLAGCSAQPAPAEKIMPYVKQPEALVLGKPLYFATAFPLSGVATGVLVESHEGRPTKIEGNPDHPACPSSYKFGPTDLFAQASILDLYDPDRSQSPTYVGRPRSWDEFLAAMRTAFGKQRTVKGAGIRILTESITSPTLAQQLTDFRQPDQFPQAKWHQYEPVGRGHASEGTRLAFGEYVNTIYNFRDAQVVLSLDADFLGCGPGHLRYTREFTAHRKVWSAEKPDQAKMNRLYVAEAAPTSTGSVADHRLPIRSGQIVDLALALAAELKVDGAPSSSAKVSDKQRAWIAAVARDLQTQRGAGLVLGGDCQPPFIHALVHAVNLALDNVGKTVIYTDPIETSPTDHSASLEELVEDIKAKRVEILIVLGGNPVYSAPANLAFAEHFAKVPLRVHLGLYQDETAIQCHWHIPQAHYLEAWSDARAFDGTVSIMQPLIAPLYPSAQSVHELIAALLEQPNRQGYDIVRGHWLDRLSKLGSAAGNGKAAWEKALHDGFIAGTTFPKKEVSLKPNWAQQLPRSMDLGGNETELNFRPDPTLYDGRFANNAWLQELPKPVTKLTWDNAALMSPRTAEKLGIPYANSSASGIPGPHGGEHGEAQVDVVELRYRDQPRIQAPVFVLPGHVDDAVTIHLGHGRSRAGQIGTGSGFNAYALRTSSAPWFDTGLTVRRTGATHILACTQMHQSIGDRHPVQAGTLETYKKNPEDIKESEAANEGEEQPADNRLIPLSLYPEYPYDGYKWGMAIDLGACVGCKACVVACQAENNIPVVGKTEVTRGREMHWLRIDRYYAGKNLDNPDIYFQPVPCMHCEKAPCELVCPVGATVHSDDGLNDMVYNRCVGTRYCSNNCPYKVRRFNFLQYADFATQSVKLLHNPDVTVRSRGIMEKCTYCVQRIRAAEIEAKNQGREDPKRPGVAPIHDGEVLTACQAACPADAIVFGDLNDPNARVGKMKNTALNYTLLENYNTQPRTTYLAAVRNPNPEIVKLETA